MIHIHIKWVIAIIGIVVYLAYVLYQGAAGSKESGIGAGVGAFFKMGFATIIFLVLFIVWLIIWK